LQIQQATRNQRARPRVDKETSSTEEFRIMSRTMQFPVRQIALASFILTFAALLAGCNTVEGAGQDVKAGGRAIERSVQ